MKFNNFIAKSFYSSKLTGESLRFFEEPFFEEYGSSDTSTGTEMTWTADGHGGESFMKQPYF